MQMLWSKKPEKHFTFRVHNTVCTGLETAMYTARQRDRAWWLCDRPLRPPMPLRAVLFVPRIPPRPGGGGGVLRVVPPSPGGGGMAAGARSRAPRGSYSPPSAALVPLPSVLLPLSHPWPLWAASPSPHSRLRGGRVSLRACSAPPHVTPVPPPRPAHDWAGGGGGADCGVGGGRGVLGAPRVPPPRPSVAASAAVSCTARPRPSLQKAREERVKCELMLLKLHAQ